MSNDHRIGKFSLKYLNGLLNTGYKKIGYNDYTKYIKKGQRFHAHIFGPFIEIHIDETIDGFHNMADMPLILNTEISNIKEHYQSITPR